DPSGHGEGEVYLGFVEATTDASGQADFVFELPAGALLPFVAATATAPDGSTSEFSAAVQLPVSNEEDAVPTASALHAPYPNPLRTRATLRYDLAEAAPVRLVLFDVLGRTVRTLDEGARPAGRHEVALDAAGLPAGVYVVRIEAGAFRAAQKLVRMR